MGGLSHNVLDPAQLKRIEATHSGFLYQHLWGVAQLLTEHTDQRLLVVEHDEDIEIVTKSKHIYVQVKRHSALLRPNEIEPILARFELLRQEHAIGHRMGHADFFLVSASEASPSLLAQVASPNWPIDVRLVTPSNNETVRGVPAWRNLSDAIDWTIAAADRLQFCRLDPATLVWKLATHVQLLATGYHGEHSLSFDSLPTLREQFNLFADHTPRTPQPYRPQRNEPAIRSDSRIRIIEGVSGAGKTSWAAAASDHNAAYVIWVRAETGIADVPSYLVRKIAARLPSTVPDLCRPGASPMESLRILDQHTGHTDTSIVVDNAHVLNPTELAKCIQDTTHVHWLLLTHPGAQTRELAHRLGVNSEVLEGWSNETVAAAISALGVVPHPSDIQRLRQLTGGLPLFVEGTARIAYKDYGGNLSRLLANHTNGTLATTLPQETLVAKDVLSHLSTYARNLISLATCLRDKIPQSVLRRLGTEVLKLGSNTDAAIRELTEWSVIQPSGAATVVIHDVFRPALELARAALAPIDRTAGLRIVLEAIQARQAHGALMVDVFMDKLRIQAELGDANSVADSVHDAIDWLCEFGAGRDIELLLVDIFNTHAELSTISKLWIADALTHLACKRSDAADALIRIKQAETFACALPCADSEWIQRLAIHRVSIGRLTQDFLMAQRNFHFYSQWAAPGTEQHRVARYNFAVAANDAYELEEAARLTTEVINEYFQVLDLRPDQLLGKSPQGLATELHLKGNQDKLRRLADSLHLRGVVTQQVGSIPTFDFPYATKLYQLVGAENAALRAGLNWAYDFLRTGYITPALKLFEESLVPAVESGHFHEWIVAIYRDYAVALARAGRCQDAQRRLESIRKYYASLSPEDRTRCEETERTVASEVQRRDRDFTPLPIAICRIDRQHYDSHRPVRTPFALKAAEELAWYKRHDATAIGVLFRDISDDDYNWVVQRPNEDGHFVVTNRAVSFATPEAAAEGLIKALNDA